MYVFPFWLLIIQLTMVCYLFCTIIYLVLAFIKHERYKAQNSHQETLYRTRRQRNTLTASSSCYKPRSVPTSPLQDHHSFCKHLLLPSPGQTSHHLPRLFHQVFKISNQRNMRRIKIKETSGDLHHLLRFV